MFERRSCGNGTKGPRYGDWALIATADLREFLLIRRFPDRDKNQYAFYLLCWAPQGRPATMTYFITIAGRRWPAEITFKTGKDALGWDQSQARTWDAINRHTALTALAQLRTAAIQAALSGTAARPAAPAGPDAPAAVSETAVSTSRPADLHRRRSAARPRRPALPARHPPDQAVRRRDRPRRPPCPRLESRPPHPRPPRLPAPLVNLAQTPPGPRPLAPLQHPPRSPRHLNHEDRKKVTPRNRHALTLSHAELQRGHRLENSDCNTRDSEVIVYQH